MKFFIKREFETEVELRQKLVRNPLVFSEGINSNKFVEYTNQSTDIGFIYCNFGLKPCIVYLQQVEKLFLGINSILSYVDYKNKRILFEKKLFSLLYEILIDSSSKYAIIVCELEILVYEIDGSFIWKRGFRDIVTDFYIEKEKSIVIECMDGDKYTFLIENGEMV